MYLFPQSSPIKNLAKQFKYPITHSKSGNSYFKIQFTPFSVKEKDANAIPWSKFPRSICPAVASLCTVAEKTVSWV